MGTGIALMYFGMAGAASAFGHSLTVALSLLAAAGGSLLLIGLWTPLAGIVVALDELWGTLSQVSHQDERWMIHILLAVVAAGVAMLGPGAWSVDARLFGRKRFEIDDRTRRR